MQVDTNEFIDSLTKESQFLGFRYVQQDDRQEAEYDFHFLYVRRSPSEPWHLVADYVTKVDFDPFRDVTELTTTVIWGPLPMLAEYECNVGDNGALDALEDKAVYMTNLYDDHEDNGDGPTS